MQIDDKNFPVHMSTYILYTFRYHALTASGKRVEVQIAGRKPAPFLKDVTIIE